MALAFALTALALAVPAGVDDASAQAPPPTNTPTPTPTQTPTSTPTATPTPGPWPVFQHDLRHTGRSQWEGPTNVGQLWRYSTGSTDLTASPLVGPDGSIYVGARGYLYSISNSGSPQWRLPIGDTFGTMLQTPNSLLYVSAQNASGNVVYQITTSGTILSSRLITGTVPQASQTMAVAASGTVYFGVSASTGTSGQLYALSPSGAGGTMLLQWTAPITTGYLNGSQPAIGTDGAVYFGSYENAGTLYAVNPGGTLRWRTESLGYISSSPSIDTDGTIFIGSSTGLHAITANGLVRWSYRTSVPISYSSPAIDIDGAVYVGAGDALLAVERTGTLRWKAVCLPGGIVSSSAAISADGGIFFQAIQPGAATSAALCATDATGVMRWSFPIQYGGENGPVAASPAIGFDRTLYVGAPNGTLYALGPAEYNPALRVRLPYIQR